jgi:hypothetical protein
VYLPQSNQQGSSYPGIIQFIIGRLFGSLPSRICRAQDERPLPWRIGERLLAFVAADVDETKSFGLPLEHLRMDKRPPLS